MRESASKNLYSGEYPSSDSARFVLNVFLEESGVQLHPEMTLEQIFANNRSGFANAVIRIETEFLEILCDDELIEWLRTRTLEFVVWALDRAGGINRCPTEEFSFLGVGRPLEPASQNTSMAPNKRKQKIVGALRVADLAARPDTNDVDKFKAFKAIRKFRDLIEVYFRTARHSKKKRL